MEKGFNDQELADIMNEIENLEKEFAEETPAQHEAPVAEDEAETEEFEAFHEEAQKEAVEEIDHTEPAVLRQLVEKPIEKVVPEAAPHHDKVVHMAKPVEKVAPAAPAPVSLNFQVSGQMQLHLGFEVNGQALSLSVSEAGLEIEMDSGAKFTLPLASAKASKKVA